MDMKMIVVIVKDSEADDLTESLTGAEYRVTRVASTGGFLRSGVATLLIGVEDGQVEVVIKLIREKLAASAHRPEAEGSAEKQATLFVVPVARFEQV
jgi:uncharacterized protein YaaQ